MTQTLNRLLAAAVFSLACTLPAHAVQEAAQVEVFGLWPSFSTTCASAFSTGVPGNLASFAGIQDIALTFSGFTLTLRTNAGVNDVAGDGVRFVDLQQTLHVGHLRWTLQRPAMQASTPAASPFPGPTRST